MLNTLTDESALPNHNLTLKTGFPVALHCNIYPCKCHFNGARYILKTVHTNLLILESYTGENTDKILALPKMPCCSGNSNFLIQVFMRTQLPVRLCNVITINKVQGQSSCEAVGLDLSDTVCSHD